MRLTNYETILQLRVFKSLFTSKVITVLILIAAFVLTKIIR